MSAKDLWIVAFGALIGWVLAFTVDPTRNFFRSSAPQLWERWRQSRRRTLESRIVFLTNMHNDVSAAVAYFVRKACQIAMALIIVISIYWILIINTDWMREQMDYLDDDTILRYILISFIGVPFGGSFAFLMNVATTAARIEGYDRYMARYRAKLAALRKPDPEAHLEQKQ